MKDTKKSRRKVKLMTAVSVLLLGAVLFFFLQIKEIKVTGNKKYTAEQIESFLFQDGWSRNAAVCFYRDRFKEHEQIPFVEDYKIVFTSPFKVEVIVYEKSVVGYVSYMGSYLYFDKDGIVVESFSARLEGIPWITGLKFGHIALHQPLPVENSRVFDEILTLTQMLTTHEITVDEVHYDTHGNASLTMGQVRVFLGSNNQMNGKISELKDQLPVLEGLSGTLYLDTYNEAETVTSYRFVKDS